MQDQSTQNLALFDFEQALADTTAQHRGFLVNLTHERYKRLRLEAFLEEKGLTASFFKWETKHLPAFQKPTPE